MGASGARPMVWASWHEPGNGLQVDGEAEKPKNISKKIDPAMKESIRMSLLPEMGGLKKILSTHQAPCAHPVPHLMPPCTLPDADPVALADTGAAQCPFISPWVAPLSHHGWHRWHLMGAI